MQLRWYLMLSCAGLSLLSLAATAASGEVSVYAMEEPVSLLIPPPGVGTKMQYASVNGTYVAQMVTSTPLFCADTAQPSPVGASIQPLYYSAQAFGAQLKRPFVFGAGPGSPSVSSVATGAPNLIYGAGKMNFVGDAAGALVCYGLDANGVRRVTRDVFYDDVEGNPYNSSVKLSVFHVPLSTTDYYGYTIDVTIPALPVQDDLALVEGFDSFYFATTAAESASGQSQGFWCQTSSDRYACMGPQYPGNINYSYFDGMNTSLPAPPSGTYVYHFLVKRFLRNGVTPAQLPSSPLAIAVLFSPNDVQENRLDDNVSAGTNQTAP